MRDIAIRVEQLSKKFFAGRKQQSYSTMRETLTDAFLDPFCRISKVIRGHPMGTETDKEFWALKDISFDVNQGEVLGLIGRNGAGKSTLLKILTRITTPTKGQATVQGRVGSLLEVGTGFHPELTGRENIYLNGAILGMRRAQIEKRFDEIVEFSEISEFLDTPAKYYSSGMYMRLAFAVSAHLDSDILLVDEVLAVGDGRFQRKCMNKMQDVGKDGRTVLFVSHNMPAISGLCSRSILLEEGRMIQDGVPRDVIAAYLNYGVKTSAVREWPDVRTAPGGDVARLRAVRVRADGNRVTDVIDICQPVTIEMEYEVFKPGYILLPHYYFWNEEDICVFGTVDLDPAWRRRQRPKGYYKSIVQIPGNLLADGLLFVNANLCTLEPFTLQFLAHRAVAIRVVDTFNGESARGDYAGAMKGTVRPFLPWMTQFRPHHDTDEVSLEVQS
jgi:lipopolysaccharide transport system ATP-binding protein